MNLLKLKFIIFGYGLLLLGISNASIAPAPTAEHTQVRKAPSDPSSWIQEKPASTPSSTRKDELYSISVIRVPAHDLLLAIARDAGLDADIHPDISARVSINATGLSLGQVIARIARQAGLRYQLTERELVMTPDRPYLKTYPIDYANLSRDSSSIVSLASQIGSVEDTKMGSAGTNSGQRIGSGSVARIQNTSNNRFWMSLIRHIGDVLNGAAATNNSNCREQKASTHPEQSNEASGFQCGTPSSSSVVSANVEAGVISILGTEAQHQQIEKLIEQVMKRASRQVLIEATIAEVELSNNYQQGIDWNALNLFGSGLRYTQRPIGVFIGASNTPTAELGYTSSSGNFSGVVRLLETFGDVRVLSSPKLSVMHNQTAFMKIVDDNIYFTYEFKETDATSNSPGKRTVQSSLHSVPVGLVLAITPMIGDDNSVTLNIRPSMSRVIGHKTDPSLAFAEGDSKITNTIPVIRAREFESVLRIENGSVAVMGGLMEDSVDNSRSSVPGVASIPLIGSLFTNRNDTTRKTELVILVRPTVIIPAISGQSGWMPSIRWLV